jgi:hypothetical protein
MRVLKHYLRLSQENLGGDLNIDIGQGTCTMKYNPKINDILAADPHLARLHPLQDPATVQGALAVMHSLDLYLREISGMDRFSLQPSSGSAAILNMVSIIQAYHKDRGTAGSRDEMITTIFSHPSDAAAAAVKGYKVVTLFQGADGLPTVEDLRKAVGPRTAGLLITNPEDTGIFNPRSYALDYDLPKSIGKTRAFYGTVQVALKAYAWIRALGGRGLREVSEIAVLNNNYLLEKIRRIRGASAAHPRRIRPLCQGPPAHRAGALQLGTAVPGNWSHHGGHRLPNGRLWYAPVEQPPPVHRAPAVHGGAHRILFQGGAGRIRGGAGADLRRGLRGSPAGQDRPPPERVPAHRPGAVRRSQAVGHHLAALSAQGLDREGVSPRFEIRSRTMTIEHRPF